jgi:hypothetical protein
MFSSNYIIFYRPRSVKIHDGFFACSAFAFSRGAPFKPGKPNMFLPLGKENFPLGLKGHERAPATIFEN